ncbi:MAG: hypothetical protein Q4C93_07215, partial [Clostridia bacterium]|nr:hypothetical protein [Clostridia bacterium]
MKIERLTNGAKVILKQKGNTLCYSKTMSEFYDKYVIKETAPDYMEVFAPDNLMKTLRTKDTLTYHFQMVPNEMGQQYFEIRATRIQQTKECFQILLDFRHIDEIVEEERQHQRELEQALRDVKQNLETISALGKIYFSIYRIHLRTGQYEEISNNKESLLKTGGMETFTEAINFLEKYIVGEHRQYVEKFMDISTLSERLLEDDSVALEYMVEDGNW